MLVWILGPKSVERASVLHHPDGIESQRHHIVPYGELNGVSKGLVASKFQEVGRCNNYATLLNIPCPRKCKIVGQLLVDYALGYALTATADVPDVYLQQFWKTVKQVPNANEIIRFMVDKEEITYTMDIFCATLKLPVETPEQPFIVAATLKFIQTFLNIVGYQYLVDKILHVVVNKVNIDYASLLWWDFLHCVQQKKIVIQYPCFTKLIIVDIMSKFKSILKRLEEEYHAIKDDTPLEYEKEFVRVDIPTIQPKPFESTQGENRTPKATKTPNPVDNVVQKKKGKRAAKETSSPKPSLKINVRHLKPISTTPILPPSNDRECNEIHEATLLSLALHKTAKIAAEQENVAAVKEKLLEEDMEKIVEVEDEDEESYACEFDDSVFLNEEDSLTKLEPENHKENLKEVDNDDDEEEKKDDKKDDDDDDNDDDDQDDHELIRTRRTCKRVDVVLYDVVPKIALNATNDLIDDNLPRINTVLNVRPTTSASTTTTTIADLQQQLYLKMKFNLQAQVADPELWDILRAKFEKSSTSTSFYGDDAFHKRDHDDHQGDDANPERGNLQKGKIHLQDAWVKDPIVNEDEVSLKDETPELIEDNQFRDAEEYAYHLEQSRNYMENPIVWESRQEDIRRSKPYAIVFYGPQRNLNEPPRYLYNKDLFFLKYGNSEERRIVKVVRVTTKQQYRLDYMEQIIMMRENDKPNRFSKADFKYRNKNDIEDMYYLSLIKKVNYPGNKKLPYQDQLNRTNVDIPGNVTSSKPQRIGEAICMAHYLMDQRVRAKAAKSAKNKRKTGYAGKTPLYNKHHNDSCIVKYNNYKRVGHLTRNSLGWHLEEIHVTLTQFGKKQTRIQLYMNFDIKKSIQCVETASQFLATELGGSSDGVKNLVTASEVADSKETLRRSAG
ncbi:hypothetical protein Tco_0016730 [Tanacetum coccineum]